MSLYYKIWVDCILKAKSMPQNKNNWKIGTMVFMSMAMAIKFIFIKTIVGRYILQRPFYKIDIDILPGTILNSFASFFILYLLPMLLLNYFLIFYKNRYEQLIEKYEYRNGKLFITYFLLSLIVPLLVLYVGMFIARL